MKFQAYFILIKTIFCYSDWSFHDFMFYLSVESVNKDRQILSQSSFTQGIRHDQCCTVSFEFKPYECKADFLSHNNGKSAGHVKQKKKSPQKLRKK